MPRRQEGHLAANCPNGSVPWKTHWPREEFFNYNAAALKRKKPDYAALEKAAREYAAMMAAQPPPAPAPGGPMGGGGGPMGGGGGSMGGGGGPMGGGGGPLGVSGPMGLGVPPLQPPHPYG